MSNDVKHNDVSMNPQDVANNNLPPANARHPAVSKKKPARLFKNQKVTSKTKKAFQNLIIQDHLDAFVRNSDIALTPISSQFKEGEFVPDMIVKVILTAVTKKLKQLGLWRDECEEAHISNLFSISQTQIDRYILQNSIYADDGPTLGEDDLTDNDVGLGEHKFTHIKSSSLEPAIAFLLARSPESLQESVAKKMLAENYFHENLNELHLYPACYLYSKSAHEQETFNAIMKGGLSEVFKDYTFERFEADLPPLRLLIWREIDNFFAKNRAVKNAIKNRSHVNSPSEIDLNLVWRRYFKTYEALTTKEKNLALRVYMPQEAQTFTQTAEKMNLSNNSLKSRSKNIFKKFRKEFPEFIGISPKSPIGVFNQELHLNGLWRQSSAEQIHPLYRIDPNTGAKTEIEIPNKKPAKKVSITESFNVAEIKAWSYDNSRVPNLLDTEFFLGMRPGQITEPEEETTDDDDEKSED